MKDIPGPSVLDTMKILDEQAEKINMTSEKDDYFEGVGGEIRLKIGEVDLSVYSEAIVGSDAYDWLIATMCNEHRLDRGGTEQRAVFENIRGKLLERFLTRSTSKEPDCSYRAQFRLQCKPFCFQGHHMKTIINLLDERKLFRGSDAYGPF